MKMYFYYGVMGSSKSANALMKKFNFEEKGKKVALMKPSIDNREHENIVKSRIGIQCSAIMIHEEQKIYDILKSMSLIDTIIIDESQFLTKDQVDELRCIVNDGIMVICYGLKTDYMCKLFEGSKRLLEVCDTIREVPSMCKCGKKAIMNTRYSDNKIIYTGEQIDIGGNDKYTALCHKCWIKGTI